MIKIQNSKLNDIMMFLNSIELNGRVSRYRTKLLVDIGGVVVELAKEEKTIIEGAGGTIAENGNVEGLSDLEERLKVQAELTDVSNDRSIITERVEGQFLALYEALNDYDKPLAGSDAKAYDELLEALEEGGYSEQND